MTERVGRLATHDTLLQKLYRCIASRPVLHGENGISGTGHESYGDRQDCIATLEKQVDVSAEAFATGEFEAAVRDLENPHSHE